MPDEKEQEQLPVAWDGTHLFAAFQAAEQWLHQHVPAINQLNVFPVPDGDTGTNMHLTMNAALGSTVPAASCALVVDQVYRGALMGARGNSGVILSQIFHGLAQGLADYEVCGPHEFALALQRAATSAYGSTSDPREGTILTVIRETSEAVQQALKQTGTTMLSILATAVHAAREAVERTPSLLHVLRDAGVVDAGGQGLYIILEGMLRWAQGEPLQLAEQPTSPALSGPSAAALQAAHSDDDFGYCTNLLLQGENLPLEAIRHNLNAIGSSVVVVGDSRLLRMHVHVLRPGDVLNYAMQFGELITIEIANMDQQRRELQHQRERAQPITTHTLPPVSASHANSRVGVVSVVAGAGFAAIFHSLGVAAIVSGGQTANPSTQELLEAIAALPQEEVIVLPNNGNILLAAQQAARMTDKQVDVIPSKTIPQGIAAMIRFQADADLAANVASMQAELGHVVTAEITTAVREATIGGIHVHTGQTIALLDGSLVASSDHADDVIDTVLSRMDMPLREHLAIYYGQHIAPEQAETLATLLQTRYPDHAIEVLPGAQPVYDYILAAE